MDNDASEIAKLTERILKDPKSKLFVPLAEEYKKIGKIDMAVSVLNEGLKNNPGYVTARSFLGRLLIEQGDLTGAQKELEEVVNAIPDNLLAQRKLGDIFILLGKSTEALARYRTALSLNSSDKELASLVADMEAGNDVSARIPKPKSPASASETKHPEQAPQKTAAPATAGAQSANAPSPEKQDAGMPPSAGVAYPLAGQKSSTMPAQTGPARSEASFQEAEEIIEEIDEVESLDQPIEETTSAALSSVGAEKALEIAAKEAGKLASSGKPDDDINTDTLAELYIAQGFYDKAIEIYQRMLAERPDNDVLQKKVLKLQALAGGPPPALEVLGHASNESEAVPQTAPMRPFEDLPAGRDVFPAGEASKEIAKEPGATAAASHAAIRRKETIDRLESWLKKILKEKQE